MAMSTTCWIASYAAVKNTPAWPEHKWHLNNTATFTLESNPCSSLLTSILVRFSVHIMHLFIGHPTGRGTQAKTNLYGDFLGDLNNYFTQEVGEMREVWFPKALHHGENRGLCKVKVTSLCDSLTHVFVLLYACRFLPHDNLIVENILDSNSRQYCDKHSMKVQANPVDLYNLKRRDPGNEVVSCTVYMYHDFTPNMNWPCSKMKCLNCVKTM